MKLLELHLKGRTGADEDELGPKIGDVDLWRVLEAARAVITDKNVLLTLTVEEIEESEEPVV